MLRKIVNKVRSVVLTKLYGFCGKHISFGRNVDIANPRWVSVGSYTIIDDGAELFAHKVEGQNSPQLCIGNHCLIGKLSRIGCCNSVQIDDYVLLAPNVHITDRNHSYKDISKPIGEQNVESAAVKIGAGSWLGYGVQVMPGVSIGKHCVVAAGSVVTHDVPDFCVVAGIPARVIKRYDPATRSWLRVEG